jgi:hypothetical protein
MIRYQLHILNATHDDSLIVLALLSATSEKIRLFDNAFSSRAEGTMASYTEAEGFGFGLGARKLSKLILLDFNSRGIKSVTFDEVYRFIKEELCAKFNDRIRTPELVDFIEINNCLPVLEEAKQRAQDFLRNKWEGHARVRT